MLFESFSVELLAVLTLNLFYLPRNKIQACGMLVQLGSGIESKTKKMDIYVLLSRSNFYFVLEIK